MKIEKKEKEIRKPIYPKLMMSAGGVLAIFFASDYGIGLTSDTPGRRFTSQVPFTDYDGEITLSNDG